MAPQARLNNTVAPQAAGYVLQFERALYHLACAPANATVAVEHVDDVSLARAGEVVLQEQDKNSVRPESEVLGDRSTALWRTLQIWMTQRKGQGGTLCERYLLVTNIPTCARIATLLKGVAAGSSGPAQVVAALRDVGKARSRTKIQSIIDDVLSHDDADLTELVTRVEIVDQYDPDNSRREIADRLAIHPEADHGKILDALLGWLIRLLRTSWQERRPGVISREACVRQCREVEALQARQRFLPRPARDVQVGPADRTQARTRPFVEHLSRIEAEEEDIFQAVEHFIRFNIERHRLAVEGEVPDREWADRSDRLRQRWENIARTETREHRDWTPQELGFRILAQSTYQHLEPLAGQLCCELYMTAGHYHRLADDDVVWWDPTYRPERES